MIDFYGYITTMSWRAGIALEELGLDMAFDEAITLVEWPERLGSAKPARHLRLAFSYADDPDARDVALLPIGPGWDWITDMQNGLS